MKKLNPEDLVIYEGADYLVINKPPYLSTLEDRTDPRSALMMVRQLYPEAQVCHRIDKETSGALLFSKHNDAYRHAALQFEHRSIYKGYHALVTGLTAMEMELVNQPLRILGSGKVFVDKNRGKEASTAFTTIKNYKKHSLIRCEPLSGRTHQIRVHLAFLGTPIVGDGLYGGQGLYLSSIKTKYLQKNDREEQPLMKRFALHARSLSFKGLEGEKIEIEANYPKDFQVLINQLERNV